MAYKIRAFTDKEIYIFTTRNEWIRFIKRHGGEETMDLDDYSGQAIWLEKSGSQKFAIGVFEDSYGTCIHETVHVVDYIMNCYNIQDKEFRAYMTEYIAGQLFIICKKAFRRNV